MTLSEFGKDNLYRRFKSGRACADASPIRVQPRPSPARSSTKHGQPNQNDLGDSSAPFAAVPPAWVYQIAPRKRTREFPQNGRRETMTRVGRGQVNLPQTVFILFLVSICSFPCHKFNRP